MIAEQVGAELKYIQDSKNIVVDTLSRLGLAPPIKSESNTDILDSPPLRKLAEVFSIVLLNSANYKLSANFKRGKLTELFTTTRAEA